MSRLLRVSIGTAAALDLIHCRVDAEPTTAYTMVFSTSRCSANCAFCAQARESNANANQLSRIPWPSYPLMQIIKALTTKKPLALFKRICIQTLYYPTLVTELEDLIPTLRQHIPHLPLSIALPPLKRIEIQNIYNLGVDRVAISLDAVTPEIFSEIKGTGVNGPFTWAQHQQALETCLSIFGVGRTTTHLIIGLGETEEQSVNLIQKLTDRGITIGLFPFTPIPHTKLSTRSRSNISQYRRVQLAHYLIKNHIARINQMQFNPETNQLTHIGASKAELNKIISEGKAFQTAGCPSCNRPFFTEQPKGPIYNYPVSPNSESIKEIKTQLGGIL